MGMSTSADCRRANLCLLVEREGTLEAVAAKVGSSPIYLSQIRTQAPDIKTGRARAMGTTLARRFEKAFELPEGWMDQQHTFAGEPRGVYRVAQNLSDTKREAPEQIVWESNLSTPLPASFFVTAPDDSMAPRILAGQTIALDSTLVPRAGDGVLVSDERNHWYLRLYKQRHAAAWEAHALNDAYQSMDAQRDGLTVLAVIVGVHARWT